MIGIGIRKFIDGVFSISTLRKFTGDILAGIALGFVAGYVAKTLILAIALLIVALLWLIYMAYRGTITFIRTKVPMTLKEIIHLERTLRMNLPFIGGILAGVWVGLRCASACVI